MEGYLLIGLLIIIPIIIFGSIEDMTKNKSDEEIQEDLYLASQYLGILLLIIINVLLWPLTKIISIMRGH